MEKEERDEGRNVGVGYNLGENKGVAPLPLPPLRPPPSFHSMKLKGRHASSASNPQPLRINDYIFLYFYPFTFNVGSDPQHNPILVIIHHYS